MAVSKELQRARNIVLRRKEKLAIAVENNNKELIDLRTQKLEEAKAQLRKVEKEKAPSDDKTEGMLTGSNRGGNTDAPPGRDERPDTSVPSFTGGMTSAYQTMQQILREAGFDFAGVCGYSRRPR